MRQNVYFNFGSIKHTVSNVKSKWNSDHMQRVKMDLSERLKKKSKVEKINKTELVEK